MPIIKPLQQSNNFTEALTSNVQKYGPCPFHLNEVSMKTQRASVVKEFYPAAEDLLKQIYLASVFSSITFNEFLPSTFQAPYDRCFSGKPGMLVDQKWGQ